MFNKKKALDYILEVATYKSISQSQLIEGIYDYSHFNKMCNGKENINIEVIFACADKLNIDYNALFSYANDDIDKSLEAYKTEFKKLTYMQNYKEIENMYNQLSAIETSHILMQQFIKVIQAIVTYKTYHQPQTSLSLLYEALKYTCHTYDFDHLQCKSLSEFEIKIINDIAVFHYILGDTDQSFHIFKQLINQLNTLDIYPDSLITATYNLSLFLMNSNIYELSEYYTNYGIHLCLKKSHFLTLCLFYYNRAFLYYVKGDIHNFEEYLNKSFLLAQIQNRTHQFYDALKQDVDKMSIDGYYLKKYETLCR